MVRRRWSKDEDEFIIKNFNKLSYTEMAKILKRTYKSVSIRANRLGLRNKPQPNKKFNLNKDELYNLYVDKGLTGTQIAKIIGVSCSLVYKMLKRYGINTRPIWLSNTRKWTMRKCTELAYVIGVCMGDGSVQYSKEYNTYTVQLTVKNKEFAEKFYNALKSISLHPKISITKKGTYNVRAHSKEFCRWYVEMDIHKITSFILEKDEYIISFIQGLFDSEGDITSDNYIRIRFGDKSIDCVRLLKKCLDRLQIPYRYYCYFQNGYAGPHRIHDIQFSLHIFIQMKQKFALKL